MNKKILSLAVAAVVAAPFAAPITAQAADVSVNGAYSMAMFNTDEDLSVTTGIGTGSGKAGGGLYGGDFGISKVEFNVKSGDAFAKIATSIVSNTGGLCVTGSCVREVMAGVKVGGVDVILGRQANMYNNGVKVDTMTGTFMEARKHPGGVAKVPSFVGGLLGVSGKAGEVSYGVQYGPEYSDSYSQTNPIYAHVNFKAGPAAIGIGYQGDPAGNATTGASAKMKFGDVAVAVSLESADGAYVGGGTTGTASSIVFADVSMPLGGGTVGLGLGNNTDQSSTFARLSYQMKVGGGADFFAGVAKDDSNQRVGAGLTVKF